MLVRVLEALLSYVERGADVLPLDAVAILWKQEGTPSIHLPETHAIVQFLRRCVESVDPSVLVLTETNVRHEEDVSYVGTPGAGQAHLVYQFPLSLQRWTRCSPETPPRFDRGPRHSTRRAPAPRS